MGGSTGGGNRGGGGGGFGHNGGALSLKPAKEGNQKNRLTMSEKMGGPRWGNKSSKSVEGRGSKGDEKAVNDIPARGRRWPSVNERKQKEGGGEGVW